MAATASIVAQLRALRLKRGLTLKVVAHRLGISPWHLCRLEHERRRTVEQLERWADSLGADVAIAVPSSSDEPLPVEPLWLLVQTPSPRKRRAA